MRKYRRKQLIEQRVRDHAKIIEADSSLVTETRRESSETRNIDYEGTSPYFLG